MKKIIYCFITLFLLLNFVFANNFKIVARVNKDVITKYDLDSFIDVLTVFFNQNNISNTLNSAEALNLLIEKHIKDQTIEDEKIPFDQVEFNYYLETLKLDEIFQKNPHINQGLYKDLLKTNFLWVKVIDKKVKYNIDVKNSEINDSLEYLIDEPFRTRYNISQIIIYDRENSDSQTIINKLYKEIKTNNNFESIADQFSQDGLKNKGLVGWVDEKELNKSIYNELKILRVGETSKPIYIGDNQSGFYLLVKLNDKKREKIAQDADLTRVRYYLYNQKFILQMKKYMDLLYNNSFIEIY